MTRCLIVLLLVCFSFTAFSNDSTSTVQDRSLSFKSWTKYKTCFRLGLGIQRSFYTELGVARHKHVYGELASASSCYYAALEWVPTMLPHKDKNIFGLKAGYEAGVGIFAVGAEAKYQTDFTLTDFVITPKAGLGFLGIVNLFYGYNISFNSKPFADIGSHQVSLTYNLNRKI